MAYSGTRFPGPAPGRLRAGCGTHPDVLLVSAAFLITERTGNGPRPQGSGLQATAHDARRTLDFALTWTESSTRDLIPLRRRPYARRPRPAAGRWKHRGDSRGPEEACGGRGQAAHRPVRPGRGHSTMPVTYRVSAGRMGYRVTLSV
ncbi:DUF5954 family protein [Streptomyces sp. NPDC056549]|uniref:DUF5954 family protein n=1 Tax=Streptomyces sp. NPDC056549 TaxID=3345864 RepID=UPI0036A6E3F6